MSAQASRDEVLTTLRRLAVDILGLDADEVSEAARIREDLGVDSLELMDLISKLQKELGVRLEDDDFGGVTTVGDAVTLVEQQAEDRS